MKAISGQQSALSLDGKNIARRKFLLKADG
jgi:hypothetical protein